MSTEKAQLNLREEIPPIQKCVWGRASKELRQKRLIVCRTCARGCARNGVNLCLRRNNRRTWEGGGTTTLGEPAGVVSMQMTRHHVAKAIWVDP
jgi:hypothetical protein